MTTAGPQDAAAEKPAGGLDRDRARPIEISMLAAAESLTLDPDALGST